MRYGPQTVDASISVLYFTTYYGGQCQLVFMVPDIKLHSCKKQGLKSDWHSRATIWHAALALKTKIIICNIN